MISEHLLGLAQDNSIESCNEAKPLLLKDKWTLVNKLAFAKDKRNNIILADDGSRFYESKEVELAPIYEGMSADFELAIKLNMLDKYPRDGEYILTKYTTAGEYLDCCKRIRDTLKHCGFTSMREINEDTLELFCINLLKNGNNQALRAAGTFSRTLTVLGNFSINSMTLELPDYANVSIFPDKCFQLVKDTVSNSTDFKEWLKGGTLGNVPVEVACTILSEALEYFESKDLKRILAFVKACSLVFKEHKPNNGRQIIHNWLKADYRRDNEGTYILISRKRKDKRPDTFKRRRHNTTERGYDLAEQYFDLCDEYGVDYKFDRSITKISELTEAVRESLFRVSGALSVLTGVRESELLSLEENAFIVVNEKGKFTSRIKKTSNSSETVRPVTIHAEPIAWIASELSQTGFQHGDFNPAPSLLKVTLPWFGNDKVIDGLTWNTSGSTCNYLRNFYNEMLSQTITDFDPTLIPLSSHRFRHTWAELAVRRFDGNVPEAIRNYFRHWYGSSFTMEYIQGKLKADLPEINRAYLRELIHRAAYDDEQFYGPAGRYMLSRLKEMDIVDSDSLDQLEDEFDVLEVNEYSYCLMPKKLKTQAKCWDKFSQMPRYDDACWDNCGGCAGRFALGNGTHKDEILRKGMVAQEIINTNTERGVGNLNRFWSKRLRLAEAALKDFDGRIQLVDVSDEEVS